MATFSMYLASLPFALIKNGQKSIEMRLNDERRKGLKKEII